MLRGVSKVNMVRLMVCPNVKAAMEGGDNQEEASAQGERTQTRFSPTKMFPQFQALLGDTAKTSTPTVTPTGTFKFNLGAKIEEEMDKFTKYRTYRDDVQSPPLSSGPVSPCLSDSVGSVASDTEMEMEASNLVIDENRATGHQDKTSETDTMTKEEKRRMRRRERNKMSAKAYRERKRQRTGGETEKLAELEKKNKELHEQIHKIEEEKNFIIGLLQSKIRIPWHYVGKIWPEVETVAQITPMEPGDDSKPCCPCSPCGPSGSPSSPLALPEASSSSSPVDTQLAG